MCILPKLCPLACRTEVLCGHATSPCATAAPCAGSVCLRSQVCVRGTGGRVRWRRVGNRQGEACSGRGRRELLNVDACAGRQRRKREAGETGQLTAGSVRAAGTYGGQRDACAGGGRRVTDSEWRAASGGPCARCVRGSFGTRRGRQVGARCGGTEHREAGRRQRVLRSACACGLARAGGSKQQPAVAGASSGWRAGNGRERWQAHASATPPPLLLRTTHVVVRPHTSFSPRLKESRRERGAREEADRACAEWTEAPCLLAGAGSDGKQ
ncbi:hypothetical protein GGX14DRAFT_407865 [Mycena pura]|uniref:Uncharacterized protein n=1 Tax=Mycena pura TaxID=153505 RepID=A0AAD6UQF5_9AGAR|nr:hypothetical protein GGX14DRAFT_407865 [Mycena pura]